ncbi:MAG: hypothetical protein JXA42_09260 [Anaerolineales bacterium]|nr:hypothetical protein [Anaerolineales bacterium]
MKSTRFIWLFVLVTSVVLIAGGIVWAGEQRSPEVGRSPAAILGTGFTYQGQLKDGGKPVTGECDMEFRLYENEIGSIQAGNPITMTVPITDGLFTVTLNTGAEFGASAFNGERRWLGVSVKCNDDAAYSELGFQELTAAPYALFARSAASLHGNPVNPAEPSRGQILKWNGVMWGLSNDAGDYGNVIVVAKDGGDYATVQGALNSIVDNSAGNPYLVWVAPGVYTGTVAMKPYVDIEGAGKDVTILSGAGSADADTGTITGAANSELRNVTVRNTGGDEYAIGVYNIGTIGFRISDALIYAYGADQTNYCVYNVGENAGIFIRDTDIYLAQSTLNSFGISTYNDSGNNSVELFNVNIQSSENSTGNKTAIHSSTYGSGVSTVIADNVSIDCSSDGYVYGLQSYSNSYVFIQDSVFIIHGDILGRGIYVGTNTYPSTVKVDHSKIVASDNAIEIIGTQAHEVYVGASMLDGGINAGTAGAVTCVGCYDAGYTNSSGFTSCP